LLHQLDICHLTLFRGNRCLFQDINFSLKAGMLILIKGENGSGKTSLLRTVAGLIEPNDGLIQWNHKNINNNRQNYHKNISWLSHKHGFKGHLSIKENLQFESGLWVRSEKNNLNVLEALSLLEVSDLPFNHLSAGQKRRASIARLMLSESPLCLLDEPTSNLDSTASQIVKNWIEQHIRKNGLCLLATHQDTFFDKVSEVIELT